MSDIVLDHDATTRLVTDLTFLDAGPDAIASLQQRLDAITTHAGGDRIVVSDIETDSEGRPICKLSFNCDSYEPPTKDEFGNTVADPKAIADLRELLNGVNLDRCLFWDPIEVLTDQAVVTA